MPSSTAEKLRILVVDDDSALIRTLADILRVHGYNPETAETAHEGLRRAEERPPALAVVDLRLPDMDGMELVSRLHELSELTEVVVLTGNASVESAIAALREHSVDYLLKPVKIEQLLQVVSVATERWQRHRAEEALRDSEERYRMLFDHNPQPVWVFDRDTLRFVAVNEAAIRHYGYSREEFLGKTIEAIRPPEDIPAMRAAVKAPTRDTPRVWRHRKKDGTLIDVELTTQDMLFGDHRARLVLSVDVTERMAAQRALEARARQQAAVATFGERALVTESLAKLFDEGAALVAETLELPISSVLELRSDKKALVLRAGFGWQSSAIGQEIVPVRDDRQAGFALSRNTPAVVTDFATERRFTGSRLAIEHGIVSGAVVPIPGPTQPFGVLGAHDRRAREFTQDHVHFLQAIAHIIGTAVQRHRTETAFRQAQRLEAVGRLAGGVAHDFNNVLTAITGYGEMVREGLGELKDGDTLRDDVAEILKAAERAAGLTRQLLAFSRQQVLQSRIVELNDIVKGMEPMLRRLIGEDIDIGIMLEKELGWVKADPGQLEQVLLNLCVNARDAMPEGGKLTIETANVELNDMGRTGEHPVEAPGQYVMLAVSDTGTGMDADTKARIFEPFFTTKPAEKGTGLGLATVYGIVKQTDGEIFVYSEPGQGSTFKIYLPCVAELAGVAGAPEPRPSPTGGSETILVAEDEDSVRRLTKRVLESAGYAVLLATNGGEAEQTAQGHDGPIHLLVTDMVMPMMNGRQLAERMRECRPDMRVLYLSGYTDSAATRKGLLDEGAHFLQKPFSNDVLVRKVREILDARSA